mgnify:CR=1 FL=1|jgi:sodium pump decarboxylase gamma subunit
MISKISFFDSVIVTIFSMVVVFLVLIAIAGIINRIKVLSTDKKKSDVKKPADVVDVDDIGEFDNTIMADEQQDDVNYEELVAVISAAIAANLGVGIPDINIQTIRRVPQGASPWSDMGRKEQLLGKL